MVPVRLASAFMVVAWLSGCADSGFAERAAVSPGQVAGSKPGIMDRRRQVLLDVAAMAEGMEGARLSRVRRAGM